MRRRPILSMLTLSVLLCAVAFACLRRDRYRVTAAHKSVVAAVASGKLKPDGLGSCILPAGHQSLSVDGRIYVMRLPTGQMAVLFPGWRGKGGNCAGIVYYSPAPTRAPAQITVVTPCPGAGATLPTPVDVERQLAPNWYYVSCSLD